jgi:hypothetical protein
MSEKLKIVCFKWEPPTDKAVEKGAIRLPSVDWNSGRGICRYTAKHVNTLYNMIKRHLRIPFDFICISDHCEEDFLPEIHFIPLWDKLTHMGGCYNRMYIFSEDMKQIIGNRFVCMDLDCVIVNDITDTFDRSEDFIIWKLDLPIENHPEIVDGWYNGSMFMMDAGARASVWNKFDPETSPRRARVPGLCGTDQSWIRYHLGPDEATWSSADGIYDLRHFFQDKVKELTRIVFFPGTRDPSQEKWQKKYPWIKQNWK